MQTLKHNFSFPGKLSQSIFPDIFLTTKDAGSTDFIQAHRVVLAAVSDKLHGMCKEGGKVFVRNISYQVLEQVVSFIYKGKIEMESNEDIENLRDGLDMLKVNIVINPMNGNQVLDKTKDFYLQHQLVKGVNVKRDINETVGNPCVSDSEILVDLNTSDNECLVKAPKLVDDESSFDVCQVKIKAESFTDVMESMSNFVENKPEHGTIIETKSTPTLSVDEEMVCDQTSQECIEIEDEDKFYGPKKFVKSQTKVPCDYCDEYVSLQTYVIHCKKNHSICSDDNGKCKKKCLKCGAKVHIIAKKFHDAIYHPDVSTMGKKTSLEINEHRKSLTKIMCDFCNVSMVFSYYREHVKKHHPEINFKEQVKCGKCRMRVFKVAFKFHREIFHKSAKVKSYPARNFVTRQIMKLELPKAVMKDEQIELESSENTLSVQDQSAQPTEYQFNQVHVSESSTDYQYENKY